MEHADRSAPAPLDVLIIGAGIGGVVALHYARRAGLGALALEKRPAVGGLWSQLPAWQDIQFGRNDWTLGDLPIKGEDQTSIHNNILAWVDRFRLADGIRLNTKVVRATRVQDKWRLETQDGSYEARHLIAASGAHNRPVVPRPSRESVKLRELHSSELRHPTDLTGCDVMVVGGGASAYDLLDLCFEHEARRVMWVYRQPRWMMPTRKPKSESGGPRGLAKPQMEGIGSDQLSAILHAEMLRRYEKLGLNDIVPNEPFDLGRHQLVPGRWRMIENFGAIERHRAEVTHIAGRCVVLSTGEERDADFVLWGTGYDVDLGYFTNPSLAAIRRPEQLYEQCGSGMLALAEPNLYFLAGVLDSTGTAPWAYALMARTIMSHIRGEAAIARSPLPRKFNHFELAMHLATFDKINFPADRWANDYLELALLPPEHPLPLPP